MVNIFIPFSTICSWELNPWVYSSLAFIYEDVSLIFVLFYFLLVFMLLNKIWFNWMNTWEASSGVYSYCSIHLDHRLFLHRWLNSPFPSKGKKVSMFIGNMEGFLLYDCFSYLIYNKFILLLIHSVIFKSSS